MENLIVLRQALRAKFSNEVVLEPDAVRVTSAEAAFLERVRTTVDSEMSNPQFNVEQLSKMVGLSARQLNRKLRSLSRLSAGGFIRMMRLKRAASLLEQRSGTVAEIAYAVGFQDPDYFSRLFRQTFEMPPSEYAKNRT